MQPKSHYQRNLPHLLPPGGIIFFTFRLADSIAIAALENLAAEQEATIAETLTHLNDPKVRAAAVYRIKKAHFAKYDALLDTAKHGPTWLGETDIALIVMQEVKALSELDVVVLACCIMPNHVHLVVQLPDSAEFSASKMMQRLKGRTALAANRYLNRQGETFWRHESYDHLVRDAKELERVIAYVVNNPVKAGWVAEWTEWPHTFKA